ncbi:MAG: RNA polymerase-binding protein RbpA, partial [Nocardioides sp.]
KIEPYKTHLAYVKERRSDKEAEDILDDAINLLRSRRKSGEIIF